MESTNYLILTCDLQTSSLYQVIDTDISLHLPHHDYILVFNKNLSLQYIFSTSQKILHSP